MTYTQAIFEEAGSTLSPSLCAIIVSLVQLVANVVSIAIVDRIDRKTIFSCSAICTGVGLAVMGLHSVYKDFLTEYASIPIMAFSFTIFVASCGILPVHYVLVVEIMPKKVWAGFRCHVVHYAFHSHHSFPGKKCWQFHLFDGALGNVSGCAPIVPDDVRNVWYARLHVLLCNILLFSVNLHTRCHTGDQRKIVRVDNARTGEAKIITTTIIQVISSIQ